MSKAGIPAITMITKIGSGHSSFPPTAIITASGNTRLNSLWVARHLDKLESHGSPSPSPPHSRVICGHSSKTRVNSRGVARAGDAVCCGGLIVTYSKNGFSG